jgi:hypothetical protein
MGTLLLVLAIGDAVWDPHGVDPLVAFAGSGLVYAAALAVVALSGRQAVRRGAPEPRADPEAVPQASLGAVAAGLSLACLVFGFTFGHFLIYFGAGMLALSLGRLVVERRAERRTRARLVAHEERRR